MVSKMQIHHFPIDLTVDILKQFLTVKKGPKLNQILIHDIDHLHVKCKWKHYSRLFKNQFLHRNTVELARHTVM